MPSTANYQLEHEAPGELPGRTLTGENGSPILAEQVDTELARVDSDIASAGTPAPLAVAEVTVGTSAELELTIPAIDLHSVRIVGQARGTLAADFVALRMRLNGQTSSSTYFTQRMLRVIEDTPDHDLQGATSLFELGAICADDMPSTAFALVAVLLGNLQGDRVLMHADTSAMTGGSGVLWRTEINRGFCTFGDATTIQLFPGGGEFATGTRFELWAP